MRAAPQECTNSRSDELVEHVPEALKNTLMVMHGSGVLVPTWKVGHLTAPCLFHKHICGLLSVLTCRCTGSESLPSRDGSPPASTQSARHESRALR